MDIGSLPPRRRRPKARRRRPRWRCATHAALPPLHPKYFRARLEARYRRLRAAGAHQHHDLYYLARDLERMLPMLRPSTIRLWLRIVEAWERLAEFDRARVRRLRDLLRPHEPEADAWFRRQVAALDGGGAR